LSANPTWKRKKRAAKSVIERKAKTLLGEKGLARLCIHGRRREK
jgi:hypothetical protein